MRLGSLFSGAAGLDRAVSEVFGATAAWHSEIDPAASKVLAHHYPDVPNLGDLTKVDWAAVEPVDIIAGGFPCQDVSAAGRRAGIREGTRSGLWLEYAEVINTLRPKVVVIENVRGLLSGYAHRAVESADIAVGDGSERPLLRAAGAVLGDLADLGYDAQWTTVAASSVGAPHRRERVFILATDTQGNGRPRIYDSTSGAAACPGWEWEPAGGTGGTPAALGLLPTPRASRGASGTETMYALGGVRSNDDRTQGEVLLPTPKAADGEWGTPRTSGRPVEKSTHLTTIVSLLPTPNASDGTGGGQHPGKREGHSHQLIDYVLAPERWGKYADAIYRWENVTRPAPSPTEPNRNGNPRLNPAFSEWMMGWPAGWVTEVPGISRNDQLRIIGNGVVPQCAAVALRWLLSVELAA